MGGRFLEDKSQEPYNQYGTSIKSSALALVDLADGILRHCIADLTSKSLIRFIPDYAITMKEFFERLLDGDNPRAQDASLVKAKRKEVWPLTGVACGGELTEQLFLPTRRSLGADLFTYSKLSASLKERRKYGMVHRALETSLGTSWYKKHLLSVHHQLDW